MTKARITPDPRITQAHLRHTFDLDQDRGLLIWKNPTSTRVRVGQVAGSTANGCVRTIRQFGTQSILSRWLIWFWEYGYFSDRVVNLDNDTSNDRLENLAERRIFLPAGTQLTQGLAKRIFDYDPETGAVVRRMSTGTKDLLGVLKDAPGTGGYLHVAVFGRLWETHRMIYLRQTGKLPKAVDHINGVRTDNRWNNLRPADRMINARNRKLPSNNTSGICGVHWDVRVNKWKAQAAINKKRTYLGSFNTKEEAAAAVKAVTTGLGYSPTHGLPQHEREKYAPETN